MGSDVKQCKECKKLFYSFGSSFCPDCVEEIEKGFDRVKDYIYDHPKANVVEISQETNVSEKRILGYLKEGRLTIDENNGLLLCEECGRSIPTGRYCSGCSRRLEHELRGAYISPEEKKKQEASKGLGKMHINFFDK